MQTPSNDPQDPEARAELVHVAREMVAGNIPFIEGADQVLFLKEKMGVPNSDLDFRVFSVIQSETDHLPRQHQRPLWSALALAAIEPELQRSEAWAKAIGAESCWNLIRRFDR